jgi:hypothetical protein
MPAAGCPQFNSRTEWPSGSSAGDRQSAFPGSKAVGGVQLSPLEHEACVLVLVLPISSLPLSPGPELPAARDRYRITS